MDPELASLRASFEAYKAENNQKLDCLNESVQEVVTVLKGGLGMVGVVGMLQEHDTKIKQAEESRTFQKGAVAAIAVLGGAFGSWIVDRLTGGSAH